MTLAFVAAFVVAGVGILFVVRPQWWLAALAFLTFASLPAFVPTQITVGGLNAFAFEIPLLVAAVFVLVARPPNGWADAIAALLMAVSLMGMAYGHFLQHPDKWVINDARPIIVMALVTLVVGRMFGTTTADIALRGLRLVLWVSFLFILLGALHVIVVSGRYDDASLVSSDGAGVASVSRILGATTHLASATCAIAIGYAVVTPHGFRRTLPWLLPALAITLFAFSRNGLVLMAAALVFTPLLHRDVRAGIRAVWIAASAAVCFTVLWYLLRFVSDLPGLSYVHQVVDSYFGRVINGFGGTDSSSLYRVGERKDLREAIGFQPWIGHGFGFAYRQPSGPPTGFTATTGIYYAHEFFLWSMVKVGLVGLIGYLAAFTAPVVRVLIGPRNAFQAACAATALGFVGISHVAPIPLSMSGGPVLGALLAIAVTRMKVSRADANEGRDQALVTA